MLHHRLSIQDGEILKQAYCDLIFLLDRNYPKKSALTFVANHYTLNSTQRNILNRAALPLNLVQTIQSNLLNDYDLLKGRNFHVDVYNQLITFFSIINHDPVIICRDGVLRDIFSSLHSKKDLKVDREFLVPYFNLLLKLQPCNIHFYFDKQRSYSKNHARLFLQLLKEFSITGSCELHSAVDWKLKIQKEEVIMSHDTAVLIGTQCCFDFFSWLLSIKFSQSISQQFVIDFLNITCF
ncbi:MAG: DUF434 domain-containing protein [Promethearchaeota archaeon]